jgi:hypothetical protein
MPRESTEQRGRRRATVLRVRRYLSDIGRGDVAERTYSGWRLSELEQANRHETVADVAARLLRRHDAGPTNAT